MVANLVALLATLLGLHRGVVAAVTLARIIVCPLVAIEAAGMLPRLANSIPVEAQLGQDASHLDGLLARKLNPDRLADDFGQGKEVWGVALKQ